MIYMYTYVYDIELLRNLLISFGNTTYSKKVNHWLRKYDFSEKNAFASKR